MIGKTISHYRVIEKIGEGGMGVVYLAEHTMLGRRVAIKTLMVGGAGNQHFRSRFLREAQAVSKLSHPNIANIYDYGETDDGQPYIVMELVEGKTLNEVMHKEPLTIARAIDVVTQVAQALSEAHRHGIVHRDIKPSNIAINERGIVKVLDFGLAKHAPSAAVSAESNHYSAEHTQTREGVIVGTPLYLSPEQALGLEVDARSDLFSLGSVLYECIAGRPPFTGKSDIDICAKVIRDDPPPPSQYNANIPDNLNRVLSKILAKKATDRYQSCEEFLDAIDVVESEIGEPTEIKRKTRLSFQSLRNHAVVQTISYLFRARQTKALSLMVGVVVVGLLGFWLIPKTRVHEPRREVLQLYEKGVEALHDGAYYTARGLFEQAAQADERFPLTLARQAQVWAELDNDEKAKEMIARANVLALDESTRMTETNSLYLRAISDVVLRNMADATDTFEKIAAQAPQDTRVSAYMDLGDVYEKNEQLAKAIRTYSMIDSVASRASASMKLGILYGRQQRLNDAISAFEKAERLYRSANNPEGVSAVLIQRGTLFDNLDKSNQASEELKRALELSRQAGNKPLQVRALLQLGSVLNTQRKPDLAQQYITDAIDLARAEGMEELATKGLIDLGNVFFANGKYDQAEDCFKRAIENAAKYKGLRTSSRATLSLGSLRMQQGKTDSAVNYIQQALAFYQQGGYVKETSQALLLLGRAYDYRGDYEAAQSAFAKQLQIAKDIGDQSLEARTQMELGSSLYHEEKYVDALEHLKECYRIDSLLGNDSQLGYDLLYRGIVAQELGLSKEARADYKKAGEFAKSNNQLQAWLHLYNARLAFTEGDYPLAKRESESALALAASQYRDIAIQSKYVLGLSQIYSGTVGAGIANCREAVDSAMLTGDPRLISYARLAFAEALLKGRLAQEALLNAQQAKQTFSNSGQRESEWRALSIEAQAALLMGNTGKAKEYASQALDLSSELEKTWGKETAAPYFARQDIRRSREYLNRILAAS